MDTQMQHFSSGCMREIALSPSQAKKLQNVVRKRARTALSSVKCQVSEMICVETKAPTRYNSTADTHCILAYDPWTLIVTNPAPLSKIL